MMMTNLQPKSCDDVIECQDGQQLFRHEFEHLVSADEAASMEVREIAVGSPDYEHTVRFMLERRESALRRINENQA